MRNQLILALIAISLFSCKNNEQHIKGKITGGHGEMLYLYGFRDGEDLILDSAIIGEDDSFDLIPTKNLYKDIYRLGLHENDFLILITDSSEHVEVDAKFGELKNPISIAGSPSSEKVSVFMKSINTPLEEMFELMTQEDSSQESRILELQKSIENTTRLYLEENFSDPSALIAIQYLDPMHHLDMYEKVVTGCKTALEKSEYFESFASYIDKQKTKQSMGPRKNLADEIVIGKPLSDLALPDANGNIHRISDLKGKVVLVDCWASWCGPCRGENPNVVKNYNQFHDKGFEVFSISLDENKEKWQQAIVQDGLLWSHHVSDLKQWECIVTYQWGVESIPFSVLLDKNGIIRAHGDMLRGELLEKEIKKIIQ